MDTDLVAEIRALRSENDDLRASVAYLQELLHPPLRTPPAWRMSGQTERVALALITRPLVTREAIVVALYTSFGRDEPEGSKTIDVWLWKTRRKLAAQGATVRNIFGRGWCLDEADRTRLRAELLSADPSGASAHPATGG